MKTLVSLLGSVSLVVVSAGTALAQSTDDVRVEPSQAPAQPPMAQPVAQPPMPSAPVVSAQPMLPQTPPTQGAGQWVYVDGEGYVWVPAGAQTYQVDETPYVYLYTPALGWGWSVSPWGFGPYYYGAWVHHPGWGAYGRAYGGRYGVYGPGRVGYGAHYGYGAHPGYAGHGNVGHGGAGHAVAHGGGRSGGGHGGGGHGGGHR